MADNYIISNHYIYYTRKLQSCNRCKTVVTIICAALIAISLYIYVCLHPPSQRSALRSVVHGIKTEVCPVSRQRQEDRWTLTSVNVPTCLLGLGGAMFLAENATG